MKHDLFGTKKYGRAFTLLLIVLVGCALVLLVLRAQEATRELESTVYSGDVR